MKDKNDFYAEHLKRKHAELKAERNEMKVKMKILRLSFLEYLYAGECPCGTKFVWDENIYTIEKYVCTKKMKIYMYARKQKMYSEYSQDGPLVEFEEDFIKNLSVRLKAAGCSAQLQKRDLEEGDLKEASV